MATKQTVKRLRRPSKAALAETLTKQLVEYRSEFCEAVVEHARSGASAFDFAAKLGVNMAVLGDWADAYPEFRWAMRCAHAEWVEGLERQLRTAGKEWRADQLLAIQAVLERRDYVGPGGLRVVGGGL